MKFFLTIAAILAATTQIASSQITTTVWSFNQPIPPTLVTDVSECASVQVLSQPIVDTRSGSRIVLVDGVAASGLQACVEAGIEAELFFPYMKYSQITNTLIARECWTMNGSSYIYQGGKNDICPIQATGRCNAADKCEGGLTCATAGTARPTCPYPFSGDTVLKFVFQLTKKWDSTLHSDTIDAGMSSLWELCGKDSWKGQWESNSKGTQLTRVVHFEESDCDLIQAKGLFEDGVVNFNMNAPPSSSKIGMKILSIEKIHTVDYSDCLNKETAVLECPAYLEGCKSTRCRIGYGCDEDNSQCGTGSCKSNPFYSEGSTEEQYVCSTSNGSNINVGAVFIGLTTIAAFASILF